MYRLNSLLNPCPADADPRDWEERCEKNRGDKRHHALDAMVISFIPEWARDPVKERFFQLPEAVNRTTFCGPLEATLPKALVLPKPELEATVYGERTLHGKRFGVARIALIDFATTTVKNKRALKPAKDVKPHKIVDGAIRRDVERFFAENPNATLEEWDAWASGYRRGGPQGPRVKKLLVTITEAGALDEYRDMSKDGSGQLRRGKRHRGYFVIECSAPTKKEPDRRRLQVEPVYVHQSPQEREVALRAAPGTMIKGYFESGCTVQLDADVAHPKTPLRAGLYQLNSIWEQGNAVLTDHRSKVSAPIGLAKLMTAGLRRVS